MHKRVVLWITLLLALLFILGCGKEIGDSCSSTNDCPTGAVCDTSPPGGYCTITPCYSGDCPSEAKCIDYGMDNSFCMRRCNDDYDCRSGYSCVTTLTKANVCMYKESIEKPDAVIAKDLSEQ